MADFFVYKQQFEPALYDFMFHAESGVYSATNTDSELFRKLPLLDKPPSENPVTAKPATDKPVTENPTQINTKEVNMKEPPFLYPSEEKYSAVFMRMLPHKQRILLFFPFSCCNSVLIMKKHPLTADSIRDSHILSAAIQDYSFTLFILLQVIASLDAYGEATLIAGVLQAFRTISARKMLCACTCFFTTPHAILRMEKNRCFERCASESSVFAFYMFCILKNLWSLKECCSWRKNWSNMFCRF